MSLEDLGFGEEGMKVPTSIDYHEIARRLWLMMFKMCRGGASCDERQFEIYKQARDLAHATIDLGAEIKLMEQSK